MMKVALLAALPLMPVQWLQPLYIPAPQLDGPIIQPMQPQPPVMFPQPPPTPYSEVPRVQRNPFAQPQRRCVNCW